MKYPDLFLNSARQAKSNGFTWLYICVALIGQVLPPLLKSTPMEEYISSIVWFLTTILSTILLASLVYSVSQKELNNCKTSILDGWHKGRSKLIQVGLLTVLIFILSVIFFSFVWLLLNKSLPYASLTTSTILIALFFRPIVIFGTCAVIINNGSIGASAKTGIIMFFRNIPQVIAISGIFVFIQKLLLAVIMVFILASPYRALLSLPSVENILSYSKILEVPQIVFSDQVLSLIMYPWITIAFTHAYLRFVGNFQYSILSSRQNAG